MLMAKWELIVKCEYEYDRAILLWPFQSRRQVAGFRNLTHHSTYPTDVETLVRQKWKICVIIIHECYGPNVVANHIQEAGHETEWEGMVFGKAVVTNINHAYSNCDSGGQVQVGYCVSRYVVCACV